MKPARSSLTWERKGGDRAPYYQARAPEGDRYVIRQTPTAGRYDVLLWFASLGMEHPIARHVHGLNVAKAAAQGHYEEVKRIHR